MMQPSRTSRTPQTCWNPRPEDLTRLDPALLRGAQSRVFSANRAVSRRRNTSKEGHLHGLRRSYREMEYKSGQYSQYASSQGWAASQSYRIYTARELDSIAPSALRPSAPPPKKGFSFSG